MHKNCEINSTQKNIYVMSCYAFSSSVKYIYKGAHSPLSPGSEKEQGVA